jgi:hypothetical protein
VELPVNRRVTVDQVCDDYIAELRRKGAAEPTMTAITTMATTVITVTIIESSRELATS